MLRKLVEAFPVDAYDNVRLGQEKVFPLELFHVFKSRFGHSDVVVCTVHNLQPESDEASDKEGRAGGIGEGVRTPKTL